MATIKLSKEQEDLLVSVVKHFDDEDRAVREAQLRRYRRLKLYWNNFSQIYWSESARDYRVVAANDLANADSDQEFYDRPINVFRALLETVIAALSIQIPGVICVPDDADNPDDITTAKAGTKIAELLYKHQDAIYLFLLALYIHYTEGMIAAYTYSKEDKEYGTYKEKKYKDEEIEAFVCPHCQAQLDENLLTGQMPLFPQEEIALAEAEEFEEENAFHLDSFGQEEEKVCPECGMALDSAMQKSKLIVPRFVGLTEKPKSRICTDVYGGLYVKIADYAKKQSDTPYLIFSYETHYATVLEMYKDLWDELPKGGGNTGVNDPYEQMARLNPQYRNAFPEEQVTVRNAWLRPAAFNILTEEQSDELHKKFPNGAKVVLINEIFAEACNESLDDSWTLTKNPMHDFLVHDPTGELVVNIQDIINDLISLVMQTIEHGIEQTWADPSVVSFESQTQIEATPGYITPTKPQGGTQNISQSFYSTKSATLAPEVFQFYQIIQQLGQFVSAAMPSIFGGSQESGSSRTASEYAMSRTASLQRLQTTWRMLTVWWKEIYGKAIPGYIKLVKEDEKFVQRDAQGNFVNVWIRKAELMGKIGSVELESSETLPISDAQKAEMVMRLMELNNQEVIAALATPENMPFIRKIVQMPEFKLPGEDSRIKQLEEIQELLASEPVIQPPDEMMIMQAMATGVPPEPIKLPSVPIDLLIDNHIVEAETCRSWAISEAGRLAKKENPAGYENVLLHFQQHNQQVQMMQMQQMAMMSQQGNGAQPPKPKGDSEIREEKDVNAPIGQ